MIAPAVRNFGSHSPTWAGPIAQGCKLYSRMKPILMVNACHMVQHKMRFAHRLHPERLELIMSIVRGWSCIDCLNLQKIVVHR
jgi:hypothetical protein